MAQIRVYSYNATMLAATAGDHVRAGGLVDISQGALKVLHLEYLIMYGKLPLAVFAEKTDTILSLFALNAVTQRLEMYRIAAPNEMLKFSRKVGIFWTLPIKY